LKAITVEESGEAVVFVSGDLDVASAPTLLHYLLELMTGPTDAITLDLHELTFIDSSGLKSLIAARTDAEAAGIELALRDVAEQPRRVLEMTGLDARFTIRDDALAATPGRAAVQPSSS
jgi:anti-anti-sigma factor